MGKLPVISGKECIKALEKIGYEQRRQKGSHIILQKEDPYSQIVVPNHRVLKPGILRSIIRDAGLTVDEFQALLDSR